MGLCFACCPAADPGLGAQKVWELEPGQTEVGFGHCILCARFLAAGAEMLMRTGMDVGHP